MTINKGILVNMDMIRTIRDRSCHMLVGPALPIKVRQYAQIEQKWQTYCFEKTRNMII